MKFFVPQFFNQEPIAPVSPSCKVVAGAKTPLVATHTRGNWTELHWNGKDALVADRPTSQATFEFTGTQIGVYVWASGRKEYGAGAALCWVGASWDKGVYVDSSQSWEDADGPRYVSLSLPIA